MHQFHIFINRHIDYHVYSLYQNHSLMCYFNRIFVRCRATLFIVLLLWIPCTAAGQAIVSASVFNDANGNVIRGGAEPGLGSIGSSGLYVYLIRNSTNLTADSARISSSGLSKTMTVTLGPLYTISLSTVQYAIGTNVSITPIDKTLPARWYHTGERRGTAAGADDTPDGSFAFSGAGTTPFWFGIQRGPAADAKAYLVSNTAFSSTPPADFDGNGHLLHRQKATEDTAVIILTPAASRRLLYSTDPRRWRSTIHT